ncbi:hypothetical protein AB4Y85_13125 [Microvirga sp. 2YAF29]|uniref:hypothetical protein n=1 Tax=Microvirga sp. 2YAF29 TaxID=3233031 RepID=UPI003F9E2D02
MNMLRLTYEPDDEWHGELHAIAHASDFIGSGSAWFSRESLIGFSRALGQYPLPAHAPVAIFGGVGAIAADRPGHIQIGITIAPADITGTLLVRMELATDPLKATHRSEPQQSAVLCFITEYAALDQFRIALASMLDAGTEAILRGTPS